MRARPRFILIGLDSAELATVNRLARRNLLPNLNSLRLRGLAGATLNPIGLSAGSVWPCFYTGASPAQHGFYQHRIFDPKTYRDRLFEPSDFAGESMFDAIASAGRRVAVVDAPYHFQRRGFNGLQITDWATHAPLVDVEGRYPPNRLSTIPRELAAEVRSRFGDDPAGVCDFIGFHGEGDYRAFRDQLVERIERKLELAHWVLDKEPWDLAFIEFSECHCAGHQLWHLHNLKQDARSQAASQSLGDGVEQIYVEIDKAIGRLVEWAGPDAIVMVYGSHGMRPIATGRLILDKILQRLDGTPPTAKRRAVAAAMRGVWRKLPLRLRTALNPFMKTLVPTIDQALGETPRRHRRFFEVAANDAAGAIRLNVAGREAHGLIQPGAEYENVCRRLSDELMQLVDAETGTRFVRRVIRAQETFKGELTERLPDLLVEWNRKHAIRTVSSPRIGTVTTPYIPTRTGDHTSHGFFIVAGPGVEPKQLARPISVFDLAPSVARCFGVDLPRSEGTAIDGFPEFHRLHGVSE